MSTRSFILVYETKHSVIALCLIIDSVTVFMNAVESDSESEDSADKRLLEA